MVMQCIVLLRGTAYPRMLERAVLRLSGCDDGAWMLA
jgi:hypothetical protein